MEKQIREQETDAEARDSAYNVCIIHPWINVLIIQGIFNFVIVIQDVSEMRLYSKSNG